MSEDATPLAAALQRLASAVDSLDGAALRKLAGDRADQARTTELELMRGDRAKLAELLDQALARGRSLEAAHQEATARVDHAMALVRDALAQTES